MRHHVEGRGHGLDRRTDGEVVERRPEFRVRVATRMAKVPVLLGNREVWITVVAEVGARASRSLQVPAMAPRLRVEVSGLRA